MNRCDICGQTFGWRGCRGGTDCPGVVTVQCKKTVNKCRCTLPLGHEGDHDCAPDLANAIAKARADAFEEAAQIAESWAGFTKSGLRRKPSPEDKCFHVATSIRMRAKERK